MRTVTFSDKRIVKQVSDHFVAAWKNIRPEETFGDGAYDSFTRTYLATCEPGAGSKNIGVILALPDGRIVHAFQGFVGPDRLLVELKFALELASEVRKGVSMDELESRYQDRIAKLKSAKNLEGSLDRHIIRNISILQWWPLPDLQEFLDRTRPGISDKEHGRL